jgi:hypothetical protein
VLSVLSPPLQIISQPTGILSQAQQAQLQRFEDSVSLVRGLNSIVIIYLTGVRPFLAGLCPSRA